MAHARDRPRAGTVAIAFAPGHLSAVFRAELTARDPRARGSTGAGFVLDRGAIVRARWTPGARTGLHLSGDGPGPWPISREVARRLRAERPGRLEVHLEHELPVGQGFGMSAAGAIATALAVGRLFGRSRRRSIETAHLADLFGGGGLGGVAAILGGGLERRVRPGIPPFGRVLHRPASGRFRLIEVGPPIPSTGPLGDRAVLERTRRAYRSAEIGGSRARSVRALFRAGDRFRARLGFADPTVRRAERAVRALGYPVLHGLFGRSLLVLISPTGSNDRLDRLCQRRGWPQWEARLAGRGARLLRRGRGRTGRVRSGGIPAPSARRQSF